MSHVGDTKRAHTGRYAAEHEQTTREESHEQTQARMDARARAVGVVAPGGPTRLHPIFANRLAELDLDNRDPKTIRRNRQSFERFSTYLAEQGVDPAEVSETDLRVYLMKVLPTLVSDRTAETEATQVKTAYRYAFEDGLIPANVVTRRVKVPKADVREKAPYSHEQLRRVRASCADDLDDLIFTALAYAGIRKHELVETLREDVSFEEAIIHVRGKGGKRRRVPLHPILSRALRGYFIRRSSPEGTILGRGGSLRNVNARFRAMLERAGLDPNESNRPVHRVRLTASTSLRREGVHADVIDRIFGWSPQSIRQRYYSGVEDEELHEAILKLYASDPIERPVGVEAEQAPRQSRRKRAA